MRNRVIFTNEKEIHVTVQIDESFLANLENTTNANISSKNGSSDYHNLTATNASFLE